MKKFLFLAAVFCIVCPAQAQLLKKIADRTKQKTEEKISERISEKASDAATRPIDGNTNSKPQQKGNKPASGNNNPSGTTSKSSEADAGGEGKLTTYSKFDFVPGEKLVVAEDFMQDAVGDFPDKWNSNSSGEVVKVEGREGRWLMLSKKGRFIPEYITALPENFTLTFDLLCNEKYNFYSPALNLFMLTGSGGKSLFEWTFISYQKRSGVMIGLDGNDAGDNNGQVYVKTWENGEEVLNNEVSTRQFSAHHGRPAVKVSIWRQKSRLRLYLNEEKVYDLPRAFAAGNYANLLFDIHADMYKPEDRFLISNIRLAIGAPDTRNKLITEGKFVTRGILFDPASDRIKPESYGALKDIANVLSEAADVNVKIIGHTDSDGAEDQNLTLSKRRAEAVKSALVADFGINANRIQTDGKGESVPADSNNTPAGKANNRRVEFVKM